ncbi:MAG: hypothetical protein HQK54_10385, partial [Oligoflexales bacterium]|nr:hypothetical protein [Oligoflexales bacterium]
LLMGSKSPVSNYYARLFIDTGKQTRYLTVRNLDSKSHIIFAMHPGIEEFFWLPSGNEIIFTATGSSRYDDGIYLWDIFTNQTRNLISDLDEKYSLTSSQAENRYFLSLSSIKKSGRELYVFIRHDNGGPLDPLQFYSEKSFFKIILPEKINEKISYEYPVKGAEKSIFELRLKPSDDIKLPFKGTNAQIAWSELPTSGELQGILEQWQNFSMNYSKSPMFPYSLFWLSSIYGEVYSLLYHNRKNDALTLKAYGTELAMALSKLTNAPSYQRAMGQFIYNKLQSNQDLNYRIIKFSAPKNGELNSIWK